MYIENNSSGDFAIKHKIPLKGKKRIEALNYNGVTIDSGFLKTQMDNTFSFYSNIPNDDLLKGFRERAGLDAPGDILGGCYSKDVWHIFGQLLSAYSRMGHASKNNKIIFKANTLVSEWGKTIDKDGYFYYSKNPVAYHYTYDKMTGGLVDMYEYAGNTEAMEYLSRITDWAYKNLDRTNQYACNSGRFPNTEWYTLPENLYRAYLLTGENKYRKLADEFLYSQYYKYFEQNDYDRLMNAAKQTVWSRYHAYSHINCFCSAAMAYLVTGKEEYVTVLENAYNFIKDSQMFITGGFGPRETYTVSGQRAETLHADDFHFEAPCGSWAALKLSRYLMEITGSAKYGDWAELIIYNGIGAALPINSDGDVMYAANYSVNGAEKELCGLPWPCCAGTYPIDVAEYHNQIYYIGQNTIHINLYIASTLETKDLGVSVRLKQKTGFPEEDYSIIMVEPEVPVEFKLKFRIPKWSSRKLQIEINGDEIEYNDNEGWFEIRRKWVKGDLIRVFLPAKLQISFAENYKCYPAALSYGPVTLVAKRNTKPEIKDSDLYNMGEKAKRCDSHLKFEYKLSDETSLELVPFYEIKANEKYFMYFDPTNERIDHETFIYGPDKGAWKVDRFGHSSLTEEAFAEFKFTGTGIRLTGYSSDSCAYVDIYIDNVLAGHVSQYSECNSIPWLWEKKGLLFEDHYLKMVGSKEKNQHSKGYSINIKHATVLSDR